MTKECKETASIWSGHIADAYVGLYGLLDAIDGQSTEDEVSKIIEAANLLERVIDLLDEVSN